MNNQEISKKLFISELTVRTHKKNIMQKLNVHNIQQLILKILNQPALMN